MERGREKKERNKAGAQRLKVSWRGGGEKKKSEQNKTNEPAQMHLGGVGRW